MALTLGEKQKEFAQNVASLIQELYLEGYDVTFGEAWRPEWVAEEYARQGKGIVNSLHTLRLAIDLNLFKDGKYLTDSSEYKKAGEIWKGLHPLNRWGGDFKKPDGNHFSMEHNGVQ